MGQVVIVRAFFLHIMAAVLCGKIFIEGGAMKLKGKESFLLLASITLLFGCSDSGKNKGSREEQAFNLCSQIVAREFDPVYMVNNPPSRTRDLDNDGVPDVVERKMGTDLCRTDSDADGLNDYQEALIAGEIEPSTPINVDITCDNYGHDCDSDGDGLSNFKETHGFYHSDLDGYLSLPRLITVQEWEAFKTTQVSLSSGDLNPWLVAMNAMESSGHNRPVAIDGVSYYVIDLEKVRESITQAFLRVYGDANHAFLSSNSNQEGTVANIMNVLLAKPKYTKDLAGEEIEVFYTDALKWSTDMDPFSDAQEVSGINNVSGALHPADDPLVSAYPRVRAVLKQVIIVANNAITDSKGRSTGTNWSIDMTDSERKTSGWSIGASLDAGASKDKGPEIGIGISGGYSESTTKIKSTSRKTGGKSGVDFKSAVGVSSICAATAWFKVYFENLGTAPITDMRPAFNLHFAQGELTYEQQVALDSLNASITDENERKVAGQSFTFSPNSLNRNPLLISRLAPGARSGEYIFPFVAEGGGNRTSTICLTKEQLAFLENEGGRITINMIPGEGKISFWDANSKLVKNDGNWIDYRQLINSNGSIVEYDLIDIAGQRHRGNYVVYAGSSPRLSLAQALKRVITNKNDDGVVSRIIADCPAEFSNNTVGVCLKRNGDIDFSHSPNTFFAVHAFDQNDRSIRAQNIEPVLKQKILAGDINHIHLQPRWRYQFISYADLEFPDSAGARITATNSGFTVTFWASDQYGSSITAKLCKQGLASGEVSSECSDELTKTDLTFGTMAHFSHTLPGDYVFTGDEHILLTNADGETKVALSSADLGMFDRPYAGADRLKTDSNALKSRFGPLIDKWNSLVSYKQNYFKRFLSNIIGGNRLANYVTGANELTTNIDTYHSECSSAVERSISTPQELRDFVTTCPASRGQDLRSSLDSHNSTYSNLVRFLSVPINHMRYTPSLSYSGDIRTLTSFYNKKVIENSREKWDRYYRDRIIACHLDKRLSDARERVVTGVEIQWGFVGQVLRPWSTQQPPPKIYSHEIRGIILTTGKVNIFTGDIYDSKTVSCIGADTYTAAQLQNDVKWYDYREHQSRKHKAGPVYPYRKSIVRAPSGHAIHSFNMYLEHKHDSTLGWYYQPHVCTRSAKISLDTRTGSIGMDTGNTRLNGGDACTHLTLSVPSRTGKLFKGVTLSNSVDRNGKHFGLGTTLRTKWTTQSDIASDTRPLVLRSPPAYD